MPSTTIYENFKPTFLYIKQHSTTGLMYFGKTTKHPESYSGSGAYWLKHINKHGREHVINVWYCLFTDVDLLVDFATNFSKLNDIVNADKWANLDIETGLNGGARINNHFKTWAKLPRSEEIKLNMAKERKISNRLGKSRMIPCEVDGINFDSVTEASKHFGVTDTTIHNWIKAGRGQKFQSKTCNRTPL